MREIPDCLNRRYEALDELIKELSSAMPTRGSNKDCPGEASEDAGIKLMCNFWNILKENPDCNLTQVVQHRMGLNANSSGVFRPQHVHCFTASKCSHSDNEDNKRDSSIKIKNACCRVSQPETKAKCCSSRSVSPSTGSDPLPLSKVLCNLKEAVSFDKKCNARIGELMVAQKELQDQIQHLEHREKDGTQLLKQADCMWSCMEDTYKKKVAQSLERQKILLKELKEVEKSTAKWRKNKKDLESQFDSIGKCQKEITEKINQKTNDMKYMDMEIANFKKRTENNKKEIETVQKSYGNKKKVSDAKIASIAENVTRLQNKLLEEKKHKDNKEQEGGKYVKEAREDLQKLCRVLLQKKLENEDLRAEKEALNLEIDLLRQTCDQCKDKCGNKQKSINDEIKKIEIEIGDFKVKCLRCHQCTDTIDVRKYCSDCPRCLEARECLYDDDHCSPDPTMDCVCMGVKQKFLDNVFDNMYTVLEKQAKTEPGRAVGEAVLNCLKRSRNGKLNDETRKILQDFILTTVKKNLNLTIVGGAVKTRCEMDPETYKQLMLCLKQVKVVKPPKTDKGTVAKKDACLRWGGTSECNCPKGPKACVCTTKAPPPPKDPTPCPPPDKEDAVEVVACPHRKESAACGADCAMHSVSSNYGKEVMAYKRDPCQGQSCNFSKNMRAAQCVLGPESLLSLPKSYVAIDAYIPEIAVLEDLITCKCRSTPVKPCTCPKDLRSQPRQRIIEEVLGRYTDVSSIDKVSYTIIRNDSDDIIQYAKQLKAEIVIKWDKSGSALLQEIDEDLHILSHTENKISTETNNPSPYTQKKKLKQIDSVQTEEIAKGVKSHTVIEPTKHQLKILIESNSGQIEDQYTELSYTASGTLAMELDKKVIELIEKKNTENPNLFVALKKTESGHFVVDFNSKVSVSNENKKNTLRKTPSGTRLLEVNKELVHDLISNAVQSLTYMKQEPKINSDTAVITTIINKKYMEKEDCKEKLGCTNNETLSKENVYNKNEHYSNELKQLYEQGCEYMTIKIRRKNQVLTNNMQAPLTRTLSGNIALDVKNILSFEGIRFQSKEFPITLAKSDSDTYILDLCCNGKGPNTVVRKTSLGEILAVVKGSLEKSKIPLEIVSKEEYFKLKIKSGSYNVAEPQAVLKATPSHNYVIVVDKEFENRYTKSINNNVGDNTECSVVLCRTKSGNYIINFDETARTSSDNDQYALLQTSASGNIKVLVNGPEFENISRNGSAISGSTAFGKLLDMLPLSSREFHRENLRKSKFLDTKSSSDTNLHGKVKAKILNHKGIIAESLSDIKRTASGHYAVVLNNKSKKTFIDHLKSYLANNSQGLIPIKRSKSGGITIVLNEDEESGHYGSLKMTPSGNIYVLVDRKIISGMTKTSIENSKREPNVADTRSKYIIEKVKGTSNKTVTTTCNSRPDTCSCDASKCVCAELHTIIEDWIQDGLEKDEKQGEREIIRFSKSKKKYSNKVTKKLNAKNQDNFKDQKSPHIVIKPCECGPVLEQNPRSSEQSFFFVEAVCPYHIDRYESLSNELLEIPGLCNNKKIKILKNDVSQSKNLGQGNENQVPDWDSLEFLPPQLPSFLKDVSYR